MCKLRDREGIIRTERADILQITEIFKQELYKNINKDEDFDLPQIQNMGS